METAELFKLTRKELVELGIHVGLWPDIGYGNVGATRQELIVALAEHYKPTDQALLFREGLDAWEKATLDCKAGKLSTGETTVVFMFSHLVMNYQVNDRNIDKAPQEYIEDVAYRSSLNEYATLTEWIKADEAISDYNMLLHYFSEVTVQMIASQIHKRIWKY